MRCFISVNLPNAVISEIKKIQEELPEFFGKKIETNNLHLTLKFLGDIDEEKVELVKEKLKKIEIAKFEAEINSVGVFSKDYVRIIWLHLANCDALQKEIDRSLNGLFEPEQKFMSHLTIARVKNLKNKKKFFEKLKIIKIPKIKFSVKNFSFMASELFPEGPKYKVIWDYKLY